MSSITATTPTELSAVNRMLASVGQAPVTTFDTDQLTINDITETVQTNPEVAIAVNTLKEVSREVQSEGWSFNQEYRCEVAPNTEGIIEYPVNVLQMDLSYDVYKNRNKDAIRKEGKLYDKMNKSFIWVEPIVYCDITYLYAWDDLPIPMQDYIVAKACVTFAQRVVGDPQQIALLQQRAQELRVNAMEYECEQGDYTFFGHPKNGDFYVSYQPFHALRR